MSQVMRFFLHIPYTLGIAIAETLIAIVMRKLPAVMYLGCKSLA